MRVGMGYDVHKLVKDRKLILGGVEIPYEKGLLGHSDADCLVHAIMDAILGAVAMGDIGQHFPDTDPKFKGADSMVLMAEVLRLISEKGYVVGNVDATIIAQKPKMAPYLPEMKKRIAEVLQITEDSVNVKATTEEGLGFTGSGEGIACQAVVLLDTFENVSYTAVSADADGNVIDGRPCSSCGGCTEFRLRLKRNQKRGADFVVKKSTPPERFLIIFIL